jgi:hypothetical protein
MTDDDIRTYIHTYLCVCARPHACVCVRACVGARERARVCGCVCVCVWVCVCVCVCVCVTQRCAVSSFALLQPATSVRLCARLARRGVAECDLAHGATAHLCHGTHAFVGQTNEVIQCQFAQEGAVLAQADTPRSSGARGSPALNWPRRIAAHRTLQQVLHRRGMEYQIKTHACKSAATRVAWAWDGGYEHSATSDSLAQPLSTSASSEVHAAATAHTPALPTFQQHSSESCAQHEETADGRPMSESPIIHIGIANNPHRNR